MKFDTININNKSYRVEFNWNSTVAFLEENNLKLTALDDLADLKPSQITGFIYEAVKEGARMQKKEFPFSVHDFGAAIGVKTVGDLLLVYKRQIADDNAKVDTKKKTLFNRKK